MPDHDMVYGRMYSRRAGPDARVRSSSQCEPKAALDNLR